MIDTNKYEGHTEAPWLELEVDKVVAHQFDENDNPKMICNVYRDGDGGSAYEGVWGDNEVEANQKLIADAPKLLAEVKRMQEDTLKVVSQWFEWYGGEENEWRKLELALGLPLTPLSWEGQE